MTQAALIAIAREALLLLVIASAPPLLASLLAGLLASLFQATTQIQESILSFVPKLVAAIAALVIAGPWIAAQLARFTAQILAALSGI